MEAAEASFLRRILDLFFGTFAVPRRTKEVADCGMNGRMYPSGSEIREGAKIQECIDEQWEERINFFVSVGP